MRAALSAAIVAGLLATAAQAEPLAPGLPAGVHAAQKSGPNLYLVATVGTLAVAGVAVLISDGHSALATTVISGGQQPTVPITTTVVTTSSTGTN